MAATVVRGNASAKSAQIQNKELLAGEGKFLYGGGRAMRSSGSKHLFRGTYQPKEGAPTAAILVVFERDEQLSHARELATLAQAQLMGVGPRLLCPYVAHHTGRIALIEEDVGISLERAILGEGIPYADGSKKRTSLHVVGSEQRVLEAKKIMFDVLVQLSSLHEHGICHRDLRTANVCVRRFGDEPRDLRATLVDFGLSAQETTGGIAYANQPYVHLFETLPACMGASQQQLPSALQIDAGYLAALWYETLTGKPIEAASAEDLSNVQGRWPLFGYHEGPNPYFARRINKALDIDTLAFDLGLMLVNGNTFPDPAALAIARRIRHGGFVDACDLTRLRAEHPEGAVFDAVEQLSRQSYASYLSQVVENGLPVAYETFEWQPVGLAESTRAQVRDIPNKAFALGLRIVEREGRDPREFVESFSNVEIEYLAFLEHERWREERTASGWVYGPKDVSKRMNDALVPYEKLSEDNKEYNRVHAREIPRLLASVGLGIVRDA